MTLPSDSSMNTYPDNTVAHYVTKLARPIQLDGDYKAALTELIYPYSFHNIEEDELFFNFITRDGMNMNNIALVTIPSGYYANETEFADKLTAHFDKQLTKIS